MGRHGENIYKRIDGRWEARVICGYSLQGKARYRFLYGKSYQEAKDKRNALLRELGSASAVSTVPAGSRKLTVEQLLQEWIADHRSSIRQSTYARYQGILQRHLLPELGHYLLSALTNDLLDRYLREKLRCGRADGKGGLAPKTVADLRSVLLLALNYASRRGYSCGVSGPLYLPKSVPPRIRVLTRSEQTRLEKALLNSDEPVCLGVLLTLYSGLRIGELCALQWDDLHFEDGTLSVSKAVLRVQDTSFGSGPKTQVFVSRPKTASSVRTIPLPRFVLRRLEPFRRGAADYLLTGTGKFMEPRLCLNKYKALLRRAGVEPTTFHALRHTFATRCVESQFDPKSLSEILGHANVSTTLQRYVHPSMEMKKQQMERLEALSVCSQAEQSVEAKK